MRRHDRLAQLAACHGHLRYHGLDSLAAYRLATRSQLAQLNPTFRAMIRDLVGRANPDVMAALWPPKDVTWLVARLATDPCARLLSVSKGPHGGQSTSLLDVRYDVRDAEEERRAWRALLEGLKGAETPSR